MPTKRKAQTKLVYRMSDQCRRTKEHKEAFLAWINGRAKKPTVTEVVREMTKGSLKHLVKQDVREAAMEYWRREANYYLAHVEMVRVNIKTGNVISKPIRAWIPIKIGYQGRVEEKDYVRANRVAGNPLLTQTVLERAHSDFLAWLARWERYAEFLEVFSPVIAAYRKIEQRLEKVA